MLARLPARDLSISSPGVMHNRLLDTLVRSSLLEDHFLIFFQVSSCWIEIHTHNINFTCLIFEMLNFCDLLHRVRVQYYPKRKFNYKYHNLLIVYFNMNSKYRSFFFRERYFKHPIIWSVRNKISNVGLLHGHLYTTYAFIFYYHKCFKHSKSIDNNIMIMYMIILIDIKFEDQSA